MGGGSERDGQLKTHVEMWLDTIRQSFFMFMGGNTHTPVNTPWPSSLAADSSAFVSTGKPRMAREQKPELRTALQASPTATVTRWDMDLKLVMSLHSAPNIT